MSPRGTRQSFSKGSMIRGAGHISNHLIVICLLGFVNASAVGGQHYYPVCGDGLCEAWGPVPESTWTCPTDCPPPPCTPVFDSCDNCFRPGTGVDDDHDGIPDRLEYDLVDRFFPSIMLQSASDRDQSYAFSSVSLPFTAQPFSDPYFCNDPLECLEIRMPILYFRDDGFSFLGLFSHLGDSEFYVALVRRTTVWTIARNSASYWHLIRDFTAAHKGTIGDSSRMGAYGFCAEQCQLFDNDSATCISNGGCAWYSEMCTGGLDASGEFCGFYFREGECIGAGGDCYWRDSFCVPRATCYSSSSSPDPRFLYAAKKKHGLYHTRLECDLGAFGFDSCPGDHSNMYNDVAGNFQNVGSVTDHDSFDTSVQHPSMCDLYDVWDHTRDFGESTAVGEQLKPQFTSFDWGLPKPAQVPALAFPADNSLVHASLTFGWNAPSGDKPITYTLQVDDDSNFSSPVASASTTATSAWIGGLPRNESLFWRVRASNTAATSSWSTSRTVRVRPATPAVSGSVSNESPRLSWPSVSGASSYKIFRKLESSGAWEPWSTAGSPPWIDSLLQAPELTAVTNPNGPTGWVAYRVRSVNVQGWESFDSSAVYFELGELEGPIVE